MTIATAGALLSSDPRRLKWANSGRHSSTRFFFGFWPVASAAMMSSVLLPELWRVLGTRQEEWRTASVLEVIFQ
jgi:hypothetical protein